MKAVFIGYESERKAYRCYNPIGKRIAISRDVVFDEATTWHWCDTDGDQQATGDPFMVEYITKLVSDVIPATPMPESPHAGSPQHRRLRSMMMIWMQSMTMPISGFALLTMSLGMPHLLALHKECSTLSSISLLQMSRRHSMKRSMRSHGVKQ
jgi:hypothetical protein